MEERLERKIWGRKTGVVMTAAVSAIAFILSLPFVSWVKVVNISSLFPKIGISREAAADLYQGYSIFNLLDFVQKGGQGKIGLYAMILLMLLIAAWYFNLAYLWKAVRTKGT